MRLGTDRDSDRTKVIEAAAHAFFVLNWANTVENYGGQFAPRTELMDVAPPTPDVVVLHAASFIGALEHANRTTLPVIWRRAQLGHHRRDPTLRDFGYCMAMQAMGSGVAWTDDHSAVMIPSRVGGVDVELDVPYYEDDVFDLYDLAYTLPTAKIRRNFRKGPPE